MKDKRIKSGDAEHQKLRENIWPIVAFAAAHRGFETLLLERLVARCPSRPPTRQGLNEWLRRDPAKRMQPRYSMGLILVEEARKLIGELNSPNGPAGAAGLTQASGTASGVGSASPASETGRNRPKSCRK